MTDEARALPLPHRRALREIARALGGTEAGVLFVCVGRSNEVRERITRELQGMLGGRAVASAVLAEDDDIPWTRVQEAAETGAVVSLSFANEPPTPKLLARINVGREIASVQKISLLVWVGLGALSDLQGGAADLWAYRTGVEFFLSHEDFNVQKPAQAHPVIRLTDQLDSSLRDITWMTGRARSERELMAAVSLRLLGQSDAALRMAEEAIGRTPELRSSPLYVIARAGALYDAHRVEELTCFLNELEGSAPPVTDEGAIVIFAIKCNRIRLALDSEEWVQVNELHKGVNRLLRENPSLVLTFGSIDNMLYVHLAKAMWFAGQFSVATESLRKIEEGYSREPAAQMTGRQWEHASAEVIRGMIAHGRAETTEALRHLHRSIQARSELGALGELVDALQLASICYEEIGLVSDSRQMLRQIEYERQEVKTLTGATLQNRKHFRVDAACSAPGPRMQRALDHAEQSLDANHLADAELALAEARACHEEDDARFRSYYRQSRMARLESRLARAQGRLDSVLLPLDQIAKVLDEAGLHRERLDILNEIARLPPEAASREVRARAARTAWRITRSAGLLKPERDALEARATIAREAGNETEAVTIERSIAEIDDALRD